ncbi:sodium-coupled monocarboxylate transporter 1-like [Dermacentor albipictus]|uniref:sodium-coupled monocarboxylate transporter 1-like n=1 Tax=Dermacentor albipictus TaxID=60249 RepID=UPI0038FCB3BF
MASHILDYGAFFSLTGASLAVGCYFSFRKTATRGRSTDEAFLGSKALAKFPLAASYLATAASAVGVIGLPAHIYAYGFHLGWLIVPHLILLPFATSVVIPVLYQLNVTSVFQVR